LLKEMVLHFVPTVNVDCAHWGGNGLNANRENLNRCWFRNLQPETRCLRRYFQKLKRQGERLDLFLDLHAGGTWRNHVVLRHPEKFYQTSFRKQAAALIQKRHSLLEGLERHAGFRQSDGFEIRFRNCCASDWVKTTFPEAVAMDVEFSTTSYYDPVAKTGKPLDAQSFSWIGEGILKAFRGTFLPKLKTANERQ